MLVYLKDESLEDLTKEGNVLVDFYADWCGPCKALATELEDIATNNKDIKIIKVNVDEHEDIAVKNKIMTIPAIYVYKDGKIAKTHNGYVDKKEILSWIK